MLQQTVPYNEPEKNMLPIGLLVIALFTLDSAVQFFPALFKTLGVPTELPQSV